MPRDDLGVGAPERDRRLRLALRLARLGIGGLRAIDLGGQPSPLGGDPDPPRVGPREIPRAEISLPERVELCLAGDRYGQRLTFAPLLRRSQEAGGRVPNPDGRAEGAVGLVDPLVAELS